MHYNFGLLITLLVLSKLLQDGKCHAKDAVCGVNITMYMNTESGDVKGLREAIALNGPVSVAIDASLRSFSFYDYGVYYDKDCGQLVIQWTLDNPDILGPESIQISESHHFYAFNLA